MRLYYTGCSFWVHRWLVPPIKIAWSLLLQVFFPTPAKVSGLKFSMMSAWGFLLFVEEKNIIYGYYSVPMQGQFLSLGWTLELNLNSNSAQMAIVLRHIFHSSQASPFINYPNVSIFTCWITWDYIWAKFFHRLQASAPKYTTWSSQELSTQPVPQQVGLVRESLYQHDSVPECSLLLKTSPFKILQSGQKAIHPPQLTYFKALPIHSPG